MSAVRDEDARPLFLVPVAEVGVGDEQGGQFALGAGRRLQRHAVQPGDFRQEVLHLPQDFEDALAGGVGLERVDIGHEATVSKVSDEQLFYLQSRGLSETEAKTMIVNGFFEAFTKELPMEYAVELNRLLALQMEGSIG